MQNSIFSEHNYWTYLSGSIFSTQGIWVQRMTLGWMLWQQTHSETWLGLLAFLIFFPTILFGPLFGVMVDRINRRRAAIITSIMLGLISFLLAVLTYENLINETRLLFFALLIGITNSAYQSIRLSFVPELVSTANMPKAVAINAIIYNSSRFIGPIIAGYLIKYQSNASALFFVAACYLPLTFVLIKLKLEIRKARNKKFTFFMDIKAGLTHTYQSELILSLLLLIAVSAIFGRGLLEILPAASEALYQGGVEVLAWLNSAAGIGAILAGLMITKFSKHQLIIALRVATPLSGILLLCFSMITRIDLGLLLVASLSFCATVCGVTTQSLIQMSVSSRFRGRVMSLWGAINVGGGAIGGLLFGLLTEYVNYNFTFISVGAICILIAYLANRKLKKAASSNLSNS